MKYIFKTSSSLRLRRGRITPRHLVPPYVSYVYVSYVPYVERIGFFSIVLIYFMISVLVSVRELQPRVPWELQSRVPQHLSQVTTNRALGQQGGADGEFPMEELAVEVYNHPVYGVGLVKALRMNILGGSAEDAGSAEDVPDLFISEGAEASAPVGPAAGAEAAAEAGAAA